ncbi:hypothetical protein BZG36_03905 [Bifiguratus adelaidae]|uniref:Uncharacterized protein n=1 Tax=Bifiguratus adelaidae TaxID=1938954 RepID=A0A261XXI5_9FUNG|nr:hypothetical protein BZG36_03905 [Bifiguratus adelaidae]
MAGVVNSAGFNTVHTRYAHLDGHLALNITQDGRSVITGGSDGLVRVFHFDPKNRDSDAFTIEKHTDPLRSIASHDGVFVTAGEDGLVAIFRASDRAFSRLAYRSDLYVRCIKISPNGNHIALATDNLHINIMSMINSDEVATLRGHEKSVMSLDYDSTGKYLVSASSDGELRAWDLQGDDGTAKCIKRIGSVMNKADPDGLLLNTVAWQPHGNLVAFPGIRNVKIYNASTWSEHCELSEPHTENVITVAWSANGKYLASADVGRAFVLWNVAKREAIFQAKTKHTITGLCWHPTENALAYVTNVGQLCIWDNVMHFDAEHPAHMPRLSKAGLDRLFDNDDQPDNDIPNDNIQDDMGSDQDMEDADSISRFEHDDPLLLSGSGRVPPKIAQRFVQAPFQSGATPYKLGRRYLAFNMLGVICTIDNKTYSSVNVEFHDRGAHRNFHFTDPYNYSMAYLGEKGCFFASNAYLDTKEPGQNTDDTSDEDSKGIIYYKPHQQWGSQNSDWQLILRRESVTALAANDKGAICATSNNLVRFFSLSGIQTHLFQVANVINISASMDMVMIIHHLGPGVYENEQNLGYMLYNNERHEIMQKGSLPLKGEETILWAGFSEYKASLDQICGQLSVCHNMRYAGQAVWIPLLDSRASTARPHHEHYWPIGLTDTSMLCVISKGRERFPSFPKPIISEVALEIPLLSVENDAIKLEERYLRTKIVRAHHYSEAVISGDAEERESEFNRTDLEMDKAILQLIQMACKAEKTIRAFELVSSLSCASAIEKAIKIAQFFKYNELAERMHLFKESRFGDFAVAEKPLLLPFNRNESIPSSDMYTQGRPYGMQSILAPHNSDDFIPSAKRAKISRRSEESRMTDTEYDENSRFDFNEAPSDADISRQGTVSTPGTQSRRRNRASGPFNPFATPRLNKNKTSISKSTSFFDAIDRVGLSENVRPVLDGPLPRKEAPKKQQSTLNSFTSSVSSNTLLNDTITEDPQEMEQETNDVETQDEDEDADAPEAPTLDITLDNDTYDDSSAPKISSSERLSAFRLAA